MKMSKLNYEYNNGFINEQQKKGSSSRTNDKTNLNYVYISSTSPIPFNQLNSVSSNTYSSYDPKLSSNNSKTSNISSSNESSLLNNSYNSNDDSDLKYKTVLNNKNYHDPIYSNYSTMSTSDKNAAKRPIKFKNFPSENVKLNHNVLRNKVSGYTPIYNVINKRHSVNIDSYPSTPRSNLSTPPMLDAKSNNDKFLSYEYFSNTNYDKMSKNREKNYNTDKLTENTYSSLTGSINKDRKAKSINNVSTDYKIVAGNIEAKSEINDNSQNESPLYKKIMSKLSEIPDSLLIRKSPNSHLSSTPILNHENKTPLINSINRSNQVNNFKTHSKDNKILKSKNNSIKKTNQVSYNTVKPIDNTKYVSLIEVNPHEKANENIILSDKEKNSNKENRRAKYKSMYIETNYNKMTSDKSDIRSQDMPNDKINSQAGDLIYSSLPYYSNALPQKNSNPTYDLNDYLYSEDSSKINDESLDLDSSRLSKKDALENKQEFIKNFNLPNKISADEKTNSSHTTTKSKDSGIVTNKHGINAYIKIIDPKQNGSQNFDIRLKRFSNFDDLGVITSERLSTPSKKDSDSTFQSINNSIIKDLNTSDLTHSNINNQSSELNVSYKSTDSNNRDLVLNLTPAYNSYYGSNEYSLNESIKKKIINKEPKQKELKSNKTNTEIEEIEQATEFSLSTSYSDSISDVDSDLIEDPVIQLGSMKKKYRKKKPKNNIIIPTPEPEYTAKVISNYPAKTVFIRNIENEYKKDIHSPKKAKSNDDSNYFFNDIPKVKTKAKSKNLDEEISEITDKINSKNSNESNELNRPMRKISTPPPLPHILDAKLKRNTIHGTDNIFAKFNILENNRSPEQSKQTSITSAIRDSKLEKPVRVNHGLPPPPPIIITRQNSHPTPNSNENNTDSNKTEETASQPTSQPKIENFKVENKRAQLIKNDHVLARNAQKDLNSKNLKKDDKLLISTNLPQLDKIDYVIKTNDDKLLTNILPYHDDKKNSNFKNKRTDQKKDSKDNYYFNDYKLDEDPWSSKDFKNNNNFYENYSKENDRRRKEGNGFLMLLPGIAIPIDTDAADSDESS